MKKKLLNVMLLSCILTTTAFTQSTVHQHHNHEVVGEKSFEWTKVQNNEGIVVSFANHEMDGKNYLRIRFENTTNEFAQIAWVLKKNNQVLINETSNEILDNGSTMYDETKLIPINEGESFENFSIQFIQK